MPRFFFGCTGGADGGEAQTEEAPMRENKEAMKRHGSSRFGRHAFSVLFIGIA
jgi:hypothetical protein